MVSGWKNRLAELVVWWGVLSSAAGQGATPPARFTLQAGTRIVLTDVTVTDRDGHAVAGLDKSAFRIFDDGQEQVLNSFEEHRHRARGSSKVLAGDEVSNDYLEPPPVVSDVLFIDIDNLGAFDQMYLAEELTHFVQGLPAGEPIAIYVRDSLTPRLLQDFTSDKSKLLTAVQMAVPHFRQADAEFATDMPALMGMVALLRDLPGRKNLLWFSGGVSSLSLLPDASVLPASVDMRPVYDALETSRIAVYPIDARGLTITDGHGLVGQQHLVMEEVAQATGGRALYNDNGLASMAAQTLDAGQSFYTLTYTPHQPKLDGKWHKVRVEIGGNAFRLSYRRGYYDDGTSVSTPRNPERLRLLRDGTTTASRPTLSEPIVFRAFLSPSDPALDDSMQPQGAVPPTPVPKPNEATYAVRFQVPVSALSLTTVGGKDCMTVDTAVLVLNSLGHAVGKLTRNVTLKPNPEQLQDRPGGFVSFEQLINLPRGHQYLSVIVLDPSTGRAGTLHAALDIPSGRAQSATLHAHPPAQ